jgi:hypothetical protein
LQTRTPSRGLLGVFWFLTNRTNEFGRTVGTIRSHSFCSARRDLTLLSLSEAQPTRRGRLRLLQGRGGHASKGCESETGDTWMLGGRRRAEHGTPANRRGCASCLGINGVRSPDSGHSLKVSYICPVCHPKLHGFGTTPQLWPGIARIQSRR